MGKKRRRCQLGGDPVSPSKVTRLTSESPQRKQVGGGQQMAPVLLPMETAGSQAAPQHKHRRVQTAGGHPRKLPCQLSCPHSSDSSQRAHIELATASVHMLSPTQTGLDKGSTRPHACRPSVVLLSGSQPRSDTQLRRVGLSTESQGGPPCSQADGRPGGAPRPFFPPLPAFLTPVHRHHCQNLQPRYHKVVPGGGPGCQCSPPLSHLSHLSARWTQRPPFRSSAPPVPPLAKDNLALRSPCL